ncbi:MAG: alanine racemase [Capnocytophaga sp.]|nr:alanine racemase [Capnocytophaga sp.]
MSVQETILEIRLDNLEHNVRQLKKYLKEETLFLAVVKANSYGNNSVEIAKYLEKKNLADYFAVAFTSEGVELRKAGVTKPILIFHPQLIDFEDIIRYDLEPTLYSKRLINHFITFAKENNLNEYPFHIKCNSGMNRLGFSVEEIEEICKIIKAQNFIKVKTAFSHLLASEDLQARPFMEKQIATFKDFQQRLENYFSHKIIYHNCNTSGILNYPQAHFDMVRSGIGMYGFANDSRLQKDFRPITILKSIISQIHYIKEGDYVGYNFGFQAKEPMEIATIPVGHADGLNRIYGKEVGFVFVKDKKCSIVGNVCMDMIMVDITGLNCEEGEEVIVFDERHTSETLAETAQTISYELITSLSRRIKRKFIENN